jgi:hypothetical protein
MAKKAIYTLMGFWFPRRRFKRKRRATALFLSLSSMSKVMLLKIYRLARPYERVFSSKPPDTEWRFHLHACSTRHGYDSDRQSPVVPIPDLSRVPR